MRQAICLVCLAAVVVAGCSVVSHGEEVATLDQLRQQADEVLAQTNVTARRNIDTIFELVDRLLKEGQKKEAEKYIAQGLQLFPWNLTYQMVYARLLAEEGRQEEANEKAELVLRYAETNDLLEQARTFLGKQPLAEIEKIGPLPGSDHQVVLVPLQECEKWLVLRLQEELSSVLGIPVQMRSIAAAYPPFSRDRRGAMLNYLRRQIKEKIASQEIINALRNTKLTERDLDDEQKLMKIATYLIGQSGPQAFAAFEANLEEAIGKDPQWDAGQLQEVLFHSVDPYRRIHVAYLGITSADIYAKDYNFLFGWANPRGGVMSYRRFTADFNKEVPNQDRLVKRTLLQCLSSIGLIYGIERCSNPTCARAYPNSLAEHDAKEGALCAQCVSNFKKLFGEAGNISK